jgi:hypothetical protein
MSPTPEELGKGDFFSEYARKMDISSQYAEPITTAITNLRLQRPEAEISVYGLIVGKDGCVHPILFVENRKPDPVTTDTSVLLVAAGEKFERFFEAFDETGDDPDTGKNADWIQCFWGVGGNDGTYYVVYNQHQAGELMSKAGETGDAAIVFIPEKFNQPAIGYVDIQRSGTKMFTLEIMEKLGRGMRKAMGKS